MNPFKFGNIVTGDNFYDREEELLRIKQTLSGGNNLTLYAPRRYGKTSLITKALGELSNEGYTTVYVDFMSVYSKETFIKNYTKAIAEKQNNKIVEATKLIAKLIRGIIPSVTFDNFGNPGFSFSWVEGSNKEQTLVDVINLPEKFATNENKWIIAFDEFQEITQLNGESFEKVLRSCIQHHENISYLFLGSRTHLLKDMFNNKNRAFYNSAMLMNIDTIDDEKSVKFLQQKFNATNITISESNAKYLISKAGAIPYYIQFIAAEIWQYMTIESETDVTKDHIEKAVLQIIRLKSDYYWELTNKQTANRKKVLFALSKSVDEIFSKSTANLYNLGAGSSTQKALESFIDEGIIEKINKKFEFSDPVYKLFLQTYL